MFLKCVLIVLKILNYNKPMFQNNTKNEERLLHGITISVRPSKY